LCRYRGLFLTVPNLGLPESCIVEARVSPMKVITDTSLSVCLSTSLPLAYTLIAPTTQVARKKVSLVGLMPRPQAPMLPNKVKESRGAWSAQPSASPTASTASTASHSIGEGDDDDESEDSEEEGVRKFGDAGHPLSPFFPLFLCLLPSLPPALPYICLADHSASVSLQAISKVQKRRHGRKACSAPPSTRSSGCPKRSPAAPTACGCGSRLRCAI
jgi:hypothetical protein